MRTVVHYRNAGRSKIYDDAMAWILLGFLMYPYDVLRLMWWYTNANHSNLSFIEAQRAWADVWVFQSFVWRDL